MGYKETRNEVDAEVLGCGILTCMCIVSLTILLRWGLLHSLSLIFIHCFVSSYLIEGREVIQSTVIDAAFCIVASALLMTAGGLHFLLLLTMVGENYKNSPKIQIFHKR